MSPADVRNTTKTLFISYSRSDAEAVATLVADLENFDHEPWMDRKLTGGQLWWDEVLRNIRDADIFVFALSPSSTTSKACLREHEYAARLGKPVLPVVVEKGFQQSLLPADLGQREQVDYTNPDRAALSALIRAVGAAQPGPAVSGPLPEPPAIPATYMFDLSQEIDSPLAMSADKQDQLVAQLRNCLADDEDAEAIHTMITRFRARDDLLVRTATELSGLEQSLESGRRSRPQGSTPRPDPATPAQGPGPAPVQPDEPEAESGSVHGAWWMAPIFFGIIGGLVAWAANRETDSGTAKNMLITGVVINVLLLLIAGGV